MNPYAQYVSELENLCQNVIMGTIPKDDATVISALNGQPSRKLQQLVPYEERKNCGAFFSGSFLAREASPLITTSNLTQEGVKIIDPACGAGDLLIELAKRMDVAETLDETLSSWSNIFYGTDLHREFVMATKARLTLTALHKGAKANGFSGLTNSFHNIKEGCGVSSLTQELDYDCVIMNPPFNMVEAPKGCSWSSGKTNNAAVFFHDYIIRSKTGTRIVAILPEVLRSGTRYERWRKIIAQRIKINTIKSLGQFEPGVDVDVFLIDATIEASNATRVNWNVPSVDCKTTIAKYFKISTGTVIDFRHKHEGEEVPYLISKDLPKWVTIETVTKTRRYSGRLINPPFVVVRRTSRPDDKERAVATIINTNTPVAVDNHLIVLEPRDGLLETCENLLALLKNESCTSWLNKRIRCRHLTISSISDLPW